MADKSLICSSQCYGFLHPEHPAYLRLWCCLNHEMLYICMYWCVMSLVFWSRKWIFEKLVYRKVLKRGIRYDRKYAVQARHVEATGVHMSMNMLKGKNLYVKGDQIRYYHYHGTLDKRSEVCKHFVDPRNKTEVVTVQHENHRIDETMFEIVAPTKQFELETIGNLPTII